MKMRGLTVRLLCLLCAGCLLLCGCGSDPASNTDNGIPEEAPVLLKPSGAVQAEYRETAAERITFGRDSGKIKLTEAGSYIVTGACADGRLIVDVGKENEVTLVLRNLVLSSSDGPAIFIHSCKGATILVEGSSTLSDGEAYSESAADAGRDAAIFCKSDLSLSGDGSLSVSGKYKHGITSKGTLIVDGGTYRVDAVKKGITGKDGIEIYAGAVTVDAGDDAIHCGGCFTMTSGSLLLASGDDAIHADGAVSITAGHVTISRSHEGIEGAQVSIAGGRCSIRSEDDGINAIGDDGEETDAKPTGGITFPGEPGDESAAITISGGYTVIDAEGDGIDSNGYLTVTGGVLLISGPTSGYDGALDYQLSGRITGGRVCAAGSVGMAMNFSGAENQASVLTNASGSGGDALALCDGKGTVLCSFTPTRPYECVVFSAPGLTAGSSYSIVTGGTVKNADACGFASGSTVKGGTEADTGEITSLITGANGFGGGPGGFGGPPGSFPDGGINRPGMPPEGGRPEDRGRDKKQK